MGRHRVFDHAAKDLLFKSRRQRFKTNVPSSWVHLKSSARKSTRAASNCLRTCSAAHSDALQDQQTIERFRGCCLPPKHELCQGPIKSYIGPGKAEIIIKLKVKSML